MKSILQILIGRSGALLFGAATLLAGSAQGQFVSTAISNLYSPSGLAVDSAGVVYISDAGSNRIARFIPATGQLSTYAGLPGSTGTNNGSGIAARFNDPSGLIYTRGGLVVADQANQELRFITVGTATGTVTNLAGVPGKYGANDGPALTAHFSSPSSLVADTNGNIYIADTGNSEIRLLDINNNVSTINITNGYQLSHPQGLALDDVGNLWIADTKNNSICVISNIGSGLNQGITLIAGGGPRASGSTDDLVGTNARFSLPSGIFWDAQIGTLLVADTGNDTIRGVYETNATGVETWAVRTISGTPGTPALVNGTPANALFSQPLQIAVDVYDSGFYVVDRANNVIRDFQPSPPEPQVTPPTFGYAVFGKDGSLFVASSSAVFNNFDPPRIALEAEAGTQTYITYGPTPTDSFHSTIPIPGPTTGTTPDIYHGDNLSPAASAASIVQPLPDITLYAVGQGVGRKPSDVVSARFQFVCANPVIVGANAADLVLTDITTNALLYYTLDGSLPANDGSNTNSIGPVENGATISINLITNTLLTVRAFNPGFAPSGPSTELLSVTNFSANDISFGFQFGEASSSFVAAAGQKFYAPVTLTLLPSATMYTLQFNVTVSNEANAFGTSPSAGNSFDFTTMLRKPDPAHPGAFLPILPEMFSGTPNEFTNGLFTNATTHLLGVGWVERLGKTNLYDTTSQDLITFSQAKDIQFVSSGGKVIVGGYSFVVPTNALPGQTYRIQIGRPSATADGIGVNAALLIAPTNGSSTNGAINSFKHVTVGSAKYLVGDANNFRWFNAGDFGDGNLDSSDVLQVFESAIYGLNAPPFGSDLWDTLDSSNAQTNAAPGLFTTIFNGSDPAANALIDSMHFGDGVLDISDVYVTFRRSLDPSLAWYYRYWSNGVLNAQATSNAPVKNTITTPAPGRNDVAVAHTLTVVAGSVIASGSTAVVPLRIVAADPGGLPVRALMFDALLDPLDGSPPMTTAVSFTPNPLLGPPSASLSQGAGDLATAWFSGTNAGVSGTNLLGTLSVTLPAGAGPNAAYRVLITNFSASPNGLGIFRATVQNGLITASDRSQSTWNDGIPDSWRLLHFGTISDPASLASADPDGDGQSNWQEYVAGTDPLDPSSVFKVQPVSAPGSAFTLQWPTVPGKHYTLQSASAPGSANWTTIFTNVLGAGVPMKWTDPSGGAAQVRFFRAAVQ